MTQLTFRMSSNKPSVSVPMYRYVPIPPGGNIRQVLTKASNADYDMEWADFTGGGDTTVTLTAGETLSALKLVYEINGTAFVLDNSDDEEYVDCLSGITITAADVGEAVTIVRSGYVSDSGWSWATGRVYLGSNGSVTQVPPTTGASLMIGKAVSSTKILIDFSEAIFI